MAAKHISVPCRVTLATIHELAQAVEALQPLSPSINATRYTKGDHSHN